MFHNLDAEMARRKITRAMLAEKIGKTPMTLAECVEIKSVVNPECTVDYLFATDVTDKEKTEE